MNQARLFDQARLQRRSGRVRPATVRQVEHALWISTGVMNDWPVQGIAANEHSGVADRTTAGATPGLVLSEPRADVLPASSEGAGVPARDLEDWIALNLLLPVGPLRAKRLLERIGDPREIAYRLPLRALAGMARIGPKGIAEIEKARRDLGRRVQRERRRVEKLGIRLMPWNDDEYPAALRTLPDPPHLLYLKGDLPPAKVRIAVVVREGILAGKGQYSLDQTEQLGARRFLRLVGSAASCTSTATFSPWSRRARYEM
jgi:hypothetical protein